MPEPRLYLSPPHLSGREELYMLEALRSNWVAPVGPHLDQFERQVADQVGVEHGVGLVNGTAALHLILRHLRLQRGDEVLCSTLTFCASANPILYEGGQPVFLDSDHATWNMDPNLLEDELADAARRGRLPRAVIVADIFGQSADMDALLEITVRYGVPVIEDAAEAMGTLYQGNHVGSKAWASFFSFNGNKIITTSSGGMLCSNDQRLIEEARFLSQQARDPAPHYQHSQVGYNYRLSNILAAMGLAQLEVLEERVAARRGNFDGYREQLGSWPGISFMPEAEFGRSNRWLTVIQIDAAELGATGDELRQALSHHNIESRPVWKPLHLQPVYADCRVRGGRVAEQLFRRGLCLPSGSSLTSADRARVISVLENACRRSTRLAA